MDNYYNTSSEINNKTNNKIDNKTNQDKVKEFHDIFEIKSVDLDLIKNKELALQRLNMIISEVEEIKEAIETNDIENLAQELADVLYVTYGFGIKFNIDLNKVLDLIHQANLTKLDDQGKPLINSHGKIKKGPNYSAPDLSFISKNIINDNYKKNIENE